MERQRVHLSKGRTAGCVSGGLCSGEAFAGVIGFTHGLLGSNSPRGNPLACKLLRSAAQAAVNVQECTASACRMGTHAARRQIPMHGTDALTDEKTPVKQLHTHRFVVNIARLCIRSLLTPDGPRSRCRPPQTSATSNHQLTEYFCRSSTWITMSIWTRWWSTRSMRPTSLRRRELRPTTIRASLLAHSSR